MSTEPSAPSDGYVEHVGWLAPSGRTDLIDLVADEYERPDTSADETHPRDTDESLRIAS
jgi:hypothetical protein